MTPKILLLFLVAECMSVGSKCACIETSILLSSVTFQSLIALQSNIIEPNISPFFSTNSSSHGDGIANSLAKCTSKASMSCCLPG